MAGLLDKLARQVLNSLEPRKTTQSRPKTMSQVANRQSVVVMPVKPVAPVVGPELSEELESQIEVTHTETVEQEDTPVIITLEKEMTTENIIVENVPENKAIEKEDYLLAQIDEFRAKAQ